MKKLSFQTNQQKEIVDITDRVGEIAREQGDGLLHLFLTHTTAALSTADLDPGTDKDILEALAKMIPQHGQDITYRHPHNPEHTPDHILSTIIGTSVTLPVANGELILGTWQRVVLLELDGPRERRVIITSIPNQWPN